MIAAAEVVHIIVRSRSSLIIKLDGCKVVRRPCRRNDFSISFLNMTTIIAYDCGRGISIYMNATRTQEQIKQETGFIGLSSYSWVKE